MPPEQLSPLLRGTQATSESCLEEPNLPKDPSTPVSSPPAIPGMSSAREGTVNPHYPRGVYIFGQRSPSSPWGLNAQQRHLGPAWGGSPVPGTSWWRATAPREAEVLCGQRERGNSVQTGEAAPRKGAPLKAVPQALRPQW